jgi:hypothetical protein
MASSISPTVIAAKKGDPLTPAQFAKEVDKFGEYAKAIFNLQAELYRHGPGHKLVIGNHEVDRKKLNIFFKAWLHQRNCFKKFYATRKKKVSRNNQQLVSLYPVSDQLATFYEGANLGPLDPEDDDSEPLSDHISLVTKDRLATGGILTSLFSQYVNRNGLKNDSEKGRFMPDKRMKNALSTTKYVFKGKDLSDREIPSGTPPNKVKKIEDHNEDGEKSALELLEGRLTKKKKKKSDDEDDDDEDGDYVYDKKKGLMFLSMMIINNFYRIPVELLSEKEKKPLTDEKNIAASKKLQKTLSGITKYYNSLKEKK